MALSNLSARNVVFLCRWFTCLAELLFFLLISVCVSVSSREPSTLAVLCRVCQCLSVLSVYMRFLLRCCLCWLLSLAVRELAGVVCALVSMYG